MSSFDITYTADCRIEVELDRSITCGILLAGTSEPLEVGDNAPIPHELERVQIVGLGETQVCVRPWSSGQQARVFSVTLKPCFFDRFGELIDESGLSNLYRFLESGVHVMNLPWSRSIMNLANAALDEHYGGTLLSLYRESQSLRFTLEVAKLLDGETQIIRKVGRRQYDRVCLAREILDRSLVDPPTLIDLAKQSSVNVTTLQANFKAAFGTTIFGYVRTQRLEMARILIHDHGLGIAEAGYKVGFTNPSAFRRHFAAILGTLPQVNFRKTFDDLAFDVTMPDAEDLDYWITSRIIKDWPDRVVFYRKAPSNDRVGLTDAVHRFADITFFQAVKPAD